MLALQTDSPRRLFGAAGLAPSLAGATPPRRVMVVDDDEWVRVYLASVLKSASYEVDVANSGKAALRLLRAGSYDTLLTDCQMPEMDGLTLCQRVRVEFPDSSPYIIMFTVKGTREDRYAGFKAGADEYIIKGAPKSEVLARVSVGRRMHPTHYTLAHCNASSRRSLLLDPLTNAHNIEYFARQMPKEIQGAGRRERALSVLSCRIEGLEHLTRQYGHPAADAAMRAFADAARQCLRPGQDWFARLGEDRFMLVLPRTRFNGAERLARKLRRRFAAVPVITTAGSIRCMVKIERSEHNASSH